MRLTRAGAFGKESEIGQIVAQSPSGGVSARTEVRAGEGQHRGRTVRLLLADPDLGKDLDPSPLADAKRITVSVRSIAQGPWRPQEATGAGVGFLVLDGLLVRSALVAGTRCTELLGQGDILRPWSMDAAMASVPSEAEWRVMDKPAQLAVLDARVTRALGAWPQITCELIDRTINRARWLSFQLAICNIKRVQTRLWMVLWHFADRWGKMTPEGALIELGLSHELLGEIVGARRPSVTTALGELRREGKLEVLGRGAWLLLGEPPGRAPA